MKPLLGLIFSFLVLSTTTVYAQSNRELDERPFHISSRQSAFGVQAEFEGTYRIIDSSVEVSVSKGTIYVSEHCPYQGRRQINYIKFALWNQYDSGWRVENSAPPLNLYVIMSPRDEYTLFDLRFTLPIDSTLDLTKRGLVVEIQEEDLDLAGDEAKKGYSFVQSCRDIFIQVANEVAAEKKRCKTP